MGEELICFEIRMHSFWRCRNSWICKGKEVLSLLAPIFLILAKTLMCKVISSRRIFVLRRKLHLNCWTWAHSIEGEESNVFSRFRQRENCKVRTDGILLTYIGEDDTNVSACGPTFHHAFQLFISIILFCQEEIPIMFY